MQARIDRVTGAVNTWIVGDDDEVIVVDPGESAEAAVEREVFEEVGVRLSDVRYVASQSWPFPGSLMLGFTAVADPAAGVVVDQAEIDDARWFSRAAVRAVVAGQDGTFGLPMAASIAYRLIMDWLDAG